MKTKILASLLALLGLLGSISLAVAQGTAFTYQGQFTDGGQAANGIYDLRFAIYDTAGGGSPVAGPMTNGPVQISNGLFTVTLDFGVGVFTGEPCWLEIGVRTNGVSADFTPLTPRQPLTPSPYALFAPSAGTAATAQGTAPGVVSNLSLAPSAVTSEKIADGTVSEADLGPTLAQNTFWRLNGNAGTAPGTQYLGTTDGQALELKVNAQRALRLEPGAEAPAVIGGHLSNQVAAGADGAVIGGGGNATGPNLVMGRFGTVGGGVGNVISTNAGDTTIGGGWLNVISPFSGYATIGGGSHNTAGGVSATVAGGFANAALGQDSVVAGGYSNSVASLRAAVVGGFFNRVEPGFEGGFIGSGYGNQVAAHNSSVVGGYENSILDSTDNYVVDAVIGGGLQNQISGDQAVIGGGAANTNAAYRATIGGGSHNRIAPGYEGGFIGGGYGNRVAGANSSVVGGYENAITNLVDGFIGGGLQNQISANHTVIGGGLLNTNAGPGATLGGGNNNWIGPAANDAFIGGGVLNHVESYRSAIMGGERNAIHTNADHAVIAGGIRNGIGTNADFSAIGGGSNNTVAANATFAAIPGGLLNSATNFAFAAGRRAKANHTGTFVWADSTDADFASTATNQLLIRANGGVGVGTNNPAGATLSVAGTVRATTFEGGGINLTALNASQITSGTIPDARLAASVSRLGQTIESAEITDGTIVTADIGSIDAGKILGGDLQAARLKVGTNHTLTGSCATIAGGSNNTATALHATIGGGRGNSVANNYGTIAGGYQNTAENTYTFIGGGSGNSATGTLATVVGGDANIAGGNAATVGGGRFNESLGYRSTIGGGYANEATNYYSTIGGGYQNTVWGYAATIPGGYLNVATNSYGFAAGYRAKAWHAGAFVWGDMTNNDVRSTNDNSMTFRASGGVRIFTVGDQSAGVYLAPGGTAWSAMSDRNAKKNFRAVDTVGVLDKLAAVPVSQWNYNWEQDDAVPNIGPMAQDFKAAFFPGRDDKSITTLEFDGVALAAIQGLNEKVEVRSARSEEGIRKLRTENAELKRELAELKRLVQQLAKQPEAALQNPKSLAR